MNKHLFIKQLLLLLFCLSFSACEKASGPTVYVGYVEGVYRYISVQQPGVIMQQGVKEGDRVEAGAVLFVLDSDQQQAQLARAQAQIAQSSATADDIEQGARPEEIAALEAAVTEAKAQYLQAKQARDRYLPLVEDGVEAKIVGDRVIADFDRAQARLRAAEENVAIAKLGGRDNAVLAANAALESARASVAETRVLLGQRTINAPVAGRIEQLFFRPGEMVMPGRPVLALLPADGLRVRFFVPQKHLPDFAVGQPISVKADGLATPVEATITFIATQAEYTPPVIYSASSRDELVFLVEATLPAGAALHAGLPVDITP